MTWNGRQLQVTHNVSLDEVKGNLLRERSMSTSLKRNGPLDRFFDVIYHMAAASCRVRRCSP